jgi:integrase
MVIVPRKTRSDFTVLNDEELHKLLDSIKNSWLYTPVLLASVLGLRRGEVLGLRWSDVDFKNKIITISKSMAFICGELVLSDVKTAKSHRSLLISDNFADYLLKLRMISDCEYICSRYGSAISPNVFDKHFKHIVRSLDIPDICFHDLRHTNATLLLKKGIPAKIVSERLGHSSISVTLDTYSHVLIDMQKDSSVAFDDLI